MGHYAKIENDIVVNVIVASADIVATLDGEWVKTSYNTRNGRHYNSVGNEDHKPPLRGTYAVIGGRYDRENDVFVPPVTKAWDSDLGSSSP